MVTCFSSVHTKALVFLQRPIYLGKFYIRLLQPVPFFSIIFSILHSMIAVQLFKMLEDVNGEGNDSADDAIGDGPIPVKLGHGHHAKIGSKKYGVEWELH